MLSRDLPEHLNWNILMVQIKNKTKKNKKTKKTIWFQKLYAFVLLFTERGQTFIFNV
jgi:hypothetical protein